MFADVVQYELYLASEQLERFEEFCRERPENNRLDNRIAFFSQPYEIHISHSITQGIGSKLKKMPRSNEMTPR